jgi:hypothetical protein
VPLEHAAAEVVHDDVGTGGQLQHELPVGRVGEVRRDTLLVPVDTQVVGALPSLVERRSPPPRLVPAVRAFDLDHVGAEVA